MTKPTQNAPSPYLKPCPFCGGEPTIKRERGTINGFFVECSNERCGVYVSTAVYSNDFNKRMIEQCNSKNEETKEQCVLLRGHKSYHQTKNILWWD